MKYMYIYRFYNCHAITFIVQNGFYIYNFKPLDKISDHRLVDFKVRLPLLVSFHIPAKAFDNTKKDKTRFVALITLFSFKEFFIVSVFKILLLNYSRSRSHGIRKKCR